MKVASMMSSLKGIGREIHLSWPDDISTREIEFLTELVALQMKTYWRIASLREAGIRAVSDLEWNSWFPATHAASIAIPDNWEDTCWRHPAPHAAVPLMPTSVTKMVQIRS